MTETNISRMVIAMLHTGQSLKSSDIAGSLSQSLGWPVSVRDISAILSKMSDKSKCDLGYFIVKVRQGNAFIYGLAKEALLLSEDQVYELTLKTGGYTLNQAISDFPELGKYLPRTPAPKFRIVRQWVQNAASVAPVSIRSFFDTLSKERNVELTVRYSNKSAISLSASPKIFLLICCIACISLAIFAFLAYLFFYPVFVAGVILALASGCYIFALKYRSKL